MGHLLESPTLASPTTTYPEIGGNTITKPEYKITDAKKRFGEVRINETQYFGGVPETAWGFCTDRLMRGIDGVINLEKLYT